MQTISNNKEIQKLWSDFFTIINDINKENNEYDEISTKIKAWVNNFTSIYQAKDATSYIHSFAMHVAEFMKLYGSITTFNQQGLEKLNDISPPNNSRDQQTTTTFRLYNRYYRKEIELNYWKIRDFKELK